MTAPATQVTGPPIIPQSSSRIASLERVSLRPESLTQLDPADVVTTEREAQLLAPILERIATPE